MKQDKYTKKEIEILNLQLTATFFFIISLIVSMILTYDEKLKIFGEKLFSDKQSRRIALFNRILVVILALSFVYGNYVTEKIAEARGTQTKSLKLQLFSGELSLIASLIVLYIVYKNQQNTNFDVADTENPIF